MKFKIENERLRIRRRSENDYSYEIPELSITNSGWSTAKAALIAALEDIGELTTTGQRNKLNVELATIDVRRREITRKLSTLKELPNSPVADLLEQSALCHHAIGMLDYDEDQDWGHKVKMVGFYDQGDVDDDGDRDFIVSYTW
ncbi:hypothetical protein KAR91_62055 [Candidatus Pacearchaeota archaeon]|nr:hypothetical protein [Candidatus Pacearchaeota archaeon]